MRQKSLYLWAILAAIFLLCPPAYAAAPQDVCDIAAQHAAHDSLVPLSILKSIARVESGKTENGTFHPWPWTANVDGKGHFFSTQSDALKFAENLLSQGIINFDVGCFQINLRWHAKNFSSLENAFDPISNAAYAAKFLSQLYRQHGNWPMAVSQYHSRSAVHATAYLKKVKAAWHTLQAAGAQAPHIAPASALQNTYPLLQSTPPTDQQTNGLARGAIMPMGAPMMRFSLP